MLSVGAFESYVGAQVIDTISSAKSLDELQNMALLLAAILLSR